MQAEESTAESRLPYSCRSGLERVIILDFGRSEPCSPEESWQQKEEEEDLCALLGVEC